MDRVEKAKELFKEGYNCSEAVAGAFADAFGMDTETALKCVEGFGGGIGRMRLTCGAVCGMTFLAGLKFGSGSKCDTDNRAKLYEIVRMMASEFEEKNGSIECKTLLGMSIPKDNGAMPEKRTEDYYKKRPCVECVGDCAMIVSKYLMD